MLLRRWLRVTTPGKYRGSLPERVGGGGGGGGGVEEAVADVSSDVGVAFPEMPSMAGASAAADPGAEVGASGPARSICG